jgi:hypothetical protein
VPGRIADVQVAVGTDPREVLPEKPLHRTEDAVVFEHPGQPTFDEGVHDLPTSPFEGLSATGFGQSLVELI